MNYTEITTLALSYADRQDTETVNNIDNFLLIVESKMNRKLKTSDMSARATIDLTAADPDQEYFGLPDDFGGLRDIELQTDSARKTMSYINPEQMNNVYTHMKAGSGGQKVYYSIIAKQLQILRIQSEGTVEIVYYQRVVPLTSTNNANWVSEDNPDAYVFGLATEISAFAKDAIAAELWGARFLLALDEIEVEDSVDRWSGSPLQVRVG